MFLLRQRTGICFWTDPKELSQWQRSKGQHLRLLAKQPLAEADAAALTCQSVVEYIRMRRRARVGSATASNDLIWLRVVLRAAKSVLACPVHPEVVYDARVACRELRLIARSKRRDRRPTGLQNCNCSTFTSAVGMVVPKIPMQDDMWFPIHSGRREAEICRLNPTSRIHPRF